MKFYNRGSEITLLKKYEDSALELAINYRWKICNGQLGGEAHQIDNN